MKKPTTFHDLAGYDLGRHEVRWNARDAILYALACGARAADLDLVYERDLRPLPGLTAALGLWAVECCGDLGVYDRKHSLHVSQSIVMHAKMPRETVLESCARVVAVADRGKATIVDIEVTSEIFTATYSIFLPGIGGWGGPAPASAKELEVPEFVPVAECQTSPEQAVLYRLTGDRHPVHVDPEFAKGFGFERPILHGLCTFGIALRMLGPAFNHHPADLQSASARLSAPVFPGACLTLQAAETKAGVAFELIAGGKQVLRGGLARFCG